MNFTVDYNKWRRAETCWDCGKKIYYKDIIVTKSLGVYDDNYYYCKKCGMKHVKEQLKEIQNCILELKNLKRR